MADLSTLEEALERFLALEEGWKDVDEDALTTNGSDIVVRYHLLDGRGRVTMSSTSQRLHFPAIPFKTPGVYVFERWEDHSPPAADSEDWRPQQIYVGEAECIRKRWAKYRNGADTHETRIRRWMQSWLAPKDRRREIRVHLVVWAQVRTPDGVVLASRIPTMEQRVLRRLVEGAVLAGYQDLLEQDFDLERPLNFNPIAMKYEEDDVLFADIDEEA